MYKDLPLVRPPPRPPRPDAFCMPRVRPRPRPRLGFGASVSDADWLEWLSDELSESDADLSDSDSLLSASEFSFPSATTKSDRTMSARIDSVLLDQILLENTCGSQAQDLLESCPHGTSTNALNAVEESSLEQVQVNL